MCKPTTITTASAATSSSSSSSSTTTTTQNPAVEVNTSGFDQNKRRVEIGILTLSVLYGFVHYLNPPVEVAASYCDDNQTPCYRRDLIAYKVTACFAMLYMGLKGMYEFYFSKEVQEMRKSSSTTRLFGVSKAADEQNVAIFCYQMWDFFVSFTIPENFEPIFLLHHVVTATTAYYSLEMQMVPFYSIFFGGVSEFSSIFLVFVDFDSLIALPDGSKAKENFDLAIFIVKGLFVLSFTCFRVIAWTRYTVWLWMDCLEGFKTGAAEKYRPGKGPFLCTFLIASVVLGGLQLYWFGEIIQKVSEML